MIDFAVFAARQDERGFLLSHAVALELDTVDIVDEAIQYDISDGGVRNQVMPSCHGGLGGDDGGFVSVAFLEDFEEVEALLIGQAVRTEVVEDEQLAAPCDREDRASADGRRLGNPSCRSSASAGLA